MRKIILAFSLLFSVNAFAIDQMYNWNGLEFVTSGNVTHVHPASPESTRLRGGWVLDISDVEPKATASHDLPYKHKGGDLVKVQVKPTIDPAKVAQRAKDVVKGAAAGAATSGNPYVTVAAIACGIFCDALIDWGVDQLSISESGELSVQVPDLDAVVVSDGFIYTYMVFGAIGSYNSFDDACNNGILAYANMRPEGYVLGREYRYPDTCEYIVSGGSMGQIYIEKKSSSCPVGNYFQNGQCTSTLPSKDIPFISYIDSQYFGKGWNHHWAKMTAEAVKNGANVFTDGTSVDITGPALVPLSTTERKTGVRLLPNTTTIAPNDYQGETQSGTLTETTTTSAKNVYQPAPFGQNTGPSITTTQQAQTVTSITNNVTNITNIVNETTSESDEAPEETVSDSPMPDLPELYEQKYKDGLSGVVTAKIAELKQTPLFQLPSSLMGDLPSSGQCPAWQLDLNLSSWANFGIHSIGADCAIWDFAALVVLISAAILCRALIFGG